MTKKAHLLGTGSVTAMLAVTLLATIIPSPAQTFTTLTDFGGSNGATPRGALVQGIDGNLYGAALSGGSTQTCQGLSGCGTIFRSTTSGALSALYTFGSTDGSHPLASPVQAADGNFYGVTQEGGANSGGTVFKLSSDGTLTTLYNFQASTGESPTGGLVLATNGDFFGTTSLGGANSNGTVFRITPQGVFKTLYNFCSQPSCSDGQSPNDGLIQASDGNFYGTTPRQGNYGTVFKVTPTGTLTTLYTFCSKTNCVDGASPNTPLVQGMDGNLYGTTQQGGANNLGTVFKISTKGVFQVLSSFCAGSECGSFPLVGLVLGSDGNLYGTTSFGGSDFNGTIFQITPRGLLTTLYNIQILDGQFPNRLTQVTDGNFYGTLQIGGSSGDVGTLFRLSTGLGPFVQALQSSGKIGSSVIILGTDLTGASSVTFNGTGATFTVVSATEITATVPTGATNGRIQVVTPSGTLVSNSRFRVLQ